MKYRSYLKKKIVSVLLCVFISLLLISGCNNRSQSIDSDQKKLSKADSLEILFPSLWVYGLPDEKDNIRQQIDELYKFRFLIKAGCSVPDSLPITAEIHNKITDSILSIRIGKNWRDRFEASVDSAFSIDSVSKIR
jgi:uncharacterized lipoprotein NlpE involved in copper resistance